MNKIVLEDFNEGNGYYKVNLAYLNKKQVEEIEALTSTWNPTDEDIKSCIRMCLTDANEQRFKDYNTNLKDCLTWLKKQGEKKSIWHNGDEEAKIGSLILLIMQSGTPIVAKIIEPKHTFNHGERWAYIDDLLEKQVEQKSAWSEEDALRLEEAIYMIKARGWIRGDDAVKLVLDWLKSLKDRVSPQPKQEWSEVDEYTLNETIQHLKELIEIDKTKHCACDVQYYQRDIDWLKSLKQRIGG